MSYLGVGQGVGSGGELTLAEELFVQNIAGLSYAKGDILYHDGTNIRRLAGGSDGSILYIESSADIPAWLVIGSSEQVLSVNSSGALAWVDYGKVKITSDDSDSGYLTVKLLAGTNVTIVENNNGTYKRLQLSAGETSFVTDSTFIIRDNVDNTKRLKFEASSITTGTTRTLTVQDVNGTIYATGGTDVAVADGGTNSSAALTNQKVMTSVGGAIVESGAVTDGESVQRNDTTFITCPLPLATCEGRLTLTSGTAVTTADVTAAATIYFTPYKGNRVYLYDGTRWKLYSSAEISLALGTLTNALPYDVYLYDNAGTLTLELTAWTNGTTRATALVLQNGVYCKTGALTRRYLGTFYTTATTTTEDSGAKRFLWNYYNRIEKKLKIQDSTNSWTYNSSTWRSANNSAANRVELLAGLVEDPLNLIVISMWIGGGTSTCAFGVGVGEDVTNANHATGVNGMSGVEQTPSADTATIIMTFSYFHKYPSSIGYHYYQWTENAINGNSVTIYGLFAGNRDSGLSGQWPC